MTSCNALPAHREGLTECIFGIQELRLHQPPPTARTPSLHKSYGFPDLLKYFELYSRDVRGSVYIHGKSLIGCSWVSWITVLQDTWIFLLIISSDIPQTQQQPPSIWLRKEDYFLIRTWFSRLVIWQHHGHLWKQVSEPEHLCCATSELLHSQMPLLGARYYTSSSSTQKDTFGH